MVTVSTGLPFGAVAPVVTVVVTVELRTTPEPL